MHLDNVNPLGQFILFRLRIPQSASASAVRIEKILEFFLENGRKSKGETFRIFFL